MRVNLVLFFPIPQIGSCSIAHHAVFVSSHFSIGRPLPTSRVYLRDVAHCPLFFYPLCISVDSGQLPPPPQVCSPPSILQLLVLLCELFQDLHLVLSASSATLCDLPFLCLPFPHSCSLVWKTSLGFFSCECMHCICPPECLVNIIFTSMVKSQEQYFYCY